MSPAYVHLLLVFVPDLCVSAVCVSSVCVAGGSLFGYVIISIKSRCKRLNIGEIQVKYMLNTGPNS